MLVNILKSSYFRKNMILNWQYSKKSFVIRTQFSIFFFFFLCLFIVLKMFFVSSYDNGKNKSCIGMNQHLRKEIVDRNNNSVCVNLTTFNLFIKSNQVDDINYVARAICNSLKGLSYSKVLKKISSNKKFIYIKRNITFQEKEKIERYGIKSLGFEKSVKRFYPYGELLSHLVGYTNIDNVGLSGIEKGVINDSILTDNSPVQLSIDLRLQNIVYQEMELAKNKFNAQGASAVVVDIDTGEVLSYVSLPNFDPNRIEQSNINLDKNSFSLYELGSIIKPLIMAIALDTNKTNLHNVYDITKLKVGRYDVKDVYDYQNKYYSVAQIMAKSSNKGIAKIGLQVGKEAIIDYMSKMQLFNKLNNLEINEKVKPIFPNLNKWNNLTVTTVCYGYSIAMSPMHYLQSMIPVVNGGNLLPLTFIKTDKPKYVKKIFNEKTSNEINILLRLAVTNGTSNRLDLKGLEIGGKTGSADKNENGQYTRKDNIVASIFACFPMKKPKYAIFAMLDKPQGIKESNFKAWGGVSTAPAVRNIIKKMASLYNIKKQKSDLYNQFKYLLYPKLDN